MIEEFTQIALDLITRYGFVAIFVFMFLETSLVFPLLPSEIVVPVAAAVLVTDPVSLGLFTLSATAGATVGSLFTYYVFGIVGYRTTERYGAYVHVSDRELVWSQRWFQRWGEGSVCWGRLLPVLRTVISIPAGFAGMRLWKFVVYSVIGSLAFNGIVAGLVLTGRRMLPSQFVVASLSKAVDRSIGHLSADFSVVIVVVAVVVLWALIVTWQFGSRRRSRSRR